MWVNDMCVHMWNMWSNEESVWEYACTTYVNMSASVYATVRAGVNMYDCMNESKYLVYIHIYVCEGHHHYHHCLTSMWLCKHTCGLEGAYMWICVQVWICMIVWMRVKGSNWTYIITLVIFTIPHNWKQNKHNQEELIFVIIITAFNN